MPTRSRPPEARHLGPLAALIAAVLGVVGCAGHGSTPITLPDVHPLGPTAAVTTATAPSPPPRPTLTRRTTRRRAELAAATAVVRRYYAAANGLRRAMRPNTLAALFEPACTCQAQVRAVRLAAARHEHYIDQAHLNALTPSWDGPREVVVLVDLDVSRGGLVAASGRRVTSVPPVHRLHRLFALALSHGRWLISSINEV